MGDHGLETPPGGFARPDVPDGRHSERNRRGQPFAGHPPRLSSAVLDALRGTFSRMRGRLGPRMLPVTGSAPREDEVANSGCPHPLVTVQGVSSLGSTQRRQGVSVLVQLWVNPSLTSGVRGGGEGEAATDLVAPQRSVSTARSNAAASVRRENDAASPGASSEARSEAAV